MALALLADALARCDLSTLRIIARYRRVKEELADAQSPDFELRLLDTVAAAERTSPTRVAALVADWIEQRPLPHLAPARVAGITELFAALRASGRRIAVLSDYPAQAKLDAMGLRPPIEAFVQHMAFRIGINMRRDVVIAVAASPACGPAPVDWSGLALSGRRVPAARPL